MVNVAQESRQPRIRALMTQGVDPFGERQQWQASHQWRRTFLAARLATPIRIES
jgi:hypothetical protein